MNERGFTLIELLVAIATGGLLLGAISWVIAGLSDDLKEVEQAAQSDEQKEASNALGTLLESARFTADGNVPLPRSRHALSLSAKAPLALGEGHRDAKLLVRVKGGVHSLVLDWPGSKVSETVIISDAEEITFGFEEGEDPRFLKGISVGLKKNGRERSLKFHPRINAVGACIFDPIAQRCRS